MSRPWHFTFDDAVRESRDLAANEKLVLYVLRTFANGRTGQVERRYAPSMTSIAAGAGLGRSTVARVLNSIEAKGWIVRSAPATKDAIVSNATNAYTLRIPTPEASSPSPAAGRGVVPERDGGSPGAGHKSDQSDLSHWATQPPPHGDGASDAGRDIAAAIERAGEEWDAERCASEMLSRGDHPAKVVSTLDRRTLAIAAEAEGWQR